MAEFYKLNEAGDYIDADSDVEELFKQKSEKIVASKLKGAREKEEAKIREEIEADVRKNAAEQIKAETKAELEEQFNKKLSESEKQNRELDVRLRRKTIAAEYGFDPSAEQFLGDGDDDDMRAKADTLKSAFAASGSNTALEKQTEPSVSKTQQKTGITVQI